MFVSGSPKGSVIDRHKWLFSWGIACRMASQGHAHVRRYIRKLTLGQLLSWIAFWIAVVWIASIALARAGEKQQSYDVRNDRGQHVLTVRPDENGGFDLLDLNGRRRETVVPDGHGCAGGTAPASPRVSSTYSHRSAESRGRVQGAKPAQGQASGRLSAAPSLGPSIPPCNQDVKENLTEFCNDDQVG